MSNKEISDILFIFSEFLAMEDVPFKPRAYEKAAQAVEEFNQDIATLYKKEGLASLEQIQGVGKGIAQKIEEYLKTGKIKELAALQKKIPVNLDELLRVEGLGPKMIKTLYQKIGVKNIIDLKSAALGGKIQNLARFGKKSEQKIIKGIEFLESSSGRFRLGDILPIARDLEKKIGSLRYVKKIAVAGSIRRWQETVGDIDLLVEADEPEAVMDFFVSLPDVRHVYAKGDTKSSVRFAIGIDVDLRVIPPHSYGAALQYFTGNKDHNVLLRKIAIRKKMKLNEYGLFRGKKQIAGDTEEGIYKALGVPMPIPELRQGRDEFKYEPRDIISLSDLKGDLQTQTDWTDGVDSIEKIVQAAERLGHEYIAITDHTKSLAMTGGSDEKKLLRQIKEIDRIQKKFRNIKILKGAEVNILKDGSLDIDDKVLSKLDMVGAAVHSHFDLSEKEQTARIMRAMENPHVDIIFHPTGRVLKKREPYKVDIDRLFLCAQETKTVMEIDAHPYRLDLNDEHIRRGMQYGVLFSIDTDAHSVAHLPFLEYGIGQARRAGLSYKSVINTLGLEALQKYFKTPKNKRSTIYSYDKRSEGKS
jgi:DNA polymerase (family 10)